MTGDYDNKTPDWNNLYIQYFLSLTFLRAVQLSAWKIIMLSRRQQELLQSCSAFLTGLRTFLVTERKGLCWMKPRTSPSSSSIQRSFSWEEIRLPGCERRRLTVVLVPEPPQQVSTQRESESETLPQQQGRTQPKSRVLVARQQEERQRLERRDTFPSTFSDPAGWDMKPSLTGLWARTQSQLCSWWKVSQWEKCDQSFPSQTLHIEWYWGFTGARSGSLGLAGGVEQCQGAAGPTLESSRVINVRYSPVIVIRSPPQ